VLNCSTLFGGLEFGFVSSIRRACAVSSLSLLRGAQHWGCTVWNCGWPGADHFGPGRPCVASSLENDGDSARLSGRGSNHS
jgi:hypothetical protein